jgi:hypothetical protein
MTRVWKADTRDERVYTRAALVNVKDLAGLKTLTGERLTGRFPGAKIRIDSEHRPADYFTAGPLFIVSQSLKSILEKFPVI